MSGVFEKLRPICVQLTQEHTSENVRKLQVALSSIGDADLAQLQEYVLFPLRLIFKQSKSVNEDLLRSVLSCMNTILSRTELTRWQMFQDMFNSFCIFLSSTDPRTVSSLSEELKLETVYCVHTLLRQATVSLLQQNVYSENFMPCLGHCVTVLLSLAEGEKLRALRIEAMHCVADMMQSSRKIHQKLTVQIGDVMAAFLPGIAISLAKIITGDTKQGQAVTMAAITALSKVVAVVMDDHLLAESQKLLARQNSQGMKDKERKLKVDRSEEWVLATSEKLSVLVKKIVAMVTNPNWKVRMELVKMMELLLLKCQKSMRNCVTVLLDGLVTLVADDYKNVSVKCKQILQQFKAAQEGKNMKSLVELLKENLYTLTMSLPRLIKAPDDTDKLSSLHLFSGYIELLGPDIKGLLNSEPHLKRLVYCFMQILELDCQDMKIIEQRSSQVIARSAIQQTTATLPQYVRKHFTYFHDEKIQEQLENILRSLGRYGDLQLLVDHFLDQFHQTSMYRKQSVLALNQIVLGITSDGDAVCSSKQDHLQSDDITSVQSVIRSLIEEYVSPVNFDIATYQQKTHTQSSDRGMDFIVTPELADSAAASIDTYRSNILQICLILEGLGDFSQVLRGDFKPLLIITLYPILEKLGDDISVISDTAFLTLMKIAINCNYGSVEELLYENADYLMNSISLNLRHLSLHPKSPRVLKVILQHSSSTILPVVEDTIEEVLNGLDDHHHQRAAEFMQVLWALLVSVTTWFPYHQDEKREKGDEKLNQFPLEGEEHDREKINADEIREFFEEYHRQKRIAAGEVEEADYAADDDDDQPEPAEEEPVDVDKPKVIPVHIRVVMEVLERCIHHLSSHDPRLRLLTLDTVIYGCKALAQSQDELLPLVHKLWQPLVQRFSDEEMVVIVKAFSVLQTMSDVAGDFIHKRVTKDVLPKLSSFLEKQAKISMKSGPAYKFTHGFKLQLSILRGIGMLSKQISVSEVELDRITSACSHYLSKQQPESLQQACVDTFKHFAAIDPDAVWLKLINLYCPVTLHPPHPGLSQYKKLEESKGNEFSDNVIILLKEQD